MSNALRSEKDTVSKRMNMVVTTYAGRATAVASPPAVGKYTLSALPGAC
jgi:hypothetical protein